MAQNQLRELRRAAERLGWEVFEEFVDRGFSGAKGRNTSRARGPGADHRDYGATRGIHAGDRSLAV